MTLAVTSAVAVPPRLWPLSWTVQPCVHLPVGSVPAGGTGQDGRKLHWDLRLPPLSGPYYHPVQTHIEAILRSPQLQIQAGVCPLRPEQDPDRAVLEGHRVTWRRETRPRPPSTEPRAGAMGTGRRGHQRRSDLKGMRAFPREAEQEALCCKHSHQRFLECWPLGQTLSPHAPGVLCKG